MSAFKRFSDKPSKEVMPGFRGRFEHGDSMTMAYWEIDAGAKLPEHSHPHEQIATVYKGKLELIIDGQAQTLEPGMVALIPSNAVHSGVAITDCEVTDVFSPVREDYKFD